MATKANISVDQGSTFSTYVSLTDDSGNPLDLTAYSGIACMRTSYASVNAVPFQVSLANGNVTLSLNVSTTSALTKPRYLYDLFLIDGSNNYTKVLEGVVYVTPSITHPNTGYTYYTLELANVQQTFYAGDIVYQSNGTANVTAIVYESDNEMWTPIYNPVNTPNYPVQVMPNNARIKVMNPSSNLSITANSGYMLFDANTNANAAIVSITQTVTQNQVGV
mgnify:FL=1|jgi:hypothetical protein